MFEVEHEIKTLDGKTITVTLKDTMRHTIRFRRMDAKFASDGQADRSLRSDFCWLLAHIGGVSGTEWHPVDEQADEKKFEQCYLGFADLVHDSEFYTAVRAVNALVRRDHPVEKPDQALTAEEEHDPN
jgi:hypothetical protein